MKIKIVERKIIDLADRRRVSFHVGQIEDADSERGKLALEHKCGEKIKETKAEKELNTNV
ncbi:MAG: hypothetical protein JKY34_12710 [Kordiimonadaceae bacterium]|nr:hypothetical protein [Kordiimonadaceae bacterium]